MAVPEHIVDFVRYQEGGLSDLPSDRAAKISLPARLDGNHTNKGVTWQTFLEVIYRINPDQALDLPPQDLTPMCDRFLSLSDDDWIVVWETFWKAVGGDDLDAQPVADLLAWWGWNSGRLIPAHALQRVLNGMSGGPQLKVDGKVGPKTIARANAVDPRYLMRNLLAERNRLLTDLVKKDPTQTAHVRGWMNANANFLLAAFQYLPLP